MLHLSRQSLGYSAGARRGEEVWGAQGVGGSQAGAGKGHQRGKEGHGLVGRRLLPGPAPTGGGAAPTSIARLMKPGETRGSGNRSSKAGVQQVRRGRERGWEASTLGPTGRPGEEVQ